MPDDVTNIQVRFLVGDDQEQFERARRLIKREVSNAEPVVISLVVLLETEWELRSRYGLPKPEIIAALSSLLDTVELHIEDEASVERAVFSWKDSNVDFADCLINAHNRALGCRATATFEGKAAKLAGFEAL